MKNILYTLFASLVITTSFAQTINLNEDGSTEFIVYNTDKLTAKDIYSKTINWINETYKNPDKVIKAKIENEMIRIEGFSQSAFSRTFKSGNKAGYDVTYILEIQIQDGKYRVKYSHQSISGTVHFTIGDVINNIPDRNGNGWDGAKDEYEGKINSLLQSLNQYIVKPKEKW